ncbi:hypothetical protein LQW54_004022 [Pestalotiopsis sp. IQ-011]
MSANETLASSLSFMTDAAHLIAQTAPETSAYLMSQRNALMFHSDLEQTEAQRQRVCGSCGHVMILGSGDLIKVQGERAFRKRHGRKTDKPAQSRPTGGTKHKILTCIKCGSYTDTKLPEAPSVSRDRIKLKQAARKKGKIQPVAKHGPPEIIEAPPKIETLSANASSKRRAKNRKQGLQALLQQSQSSSPKSGFGLNLADFMKK